MVIGSGKDGLPIISGGSRGTDLITMGLLYGDGLQYQQGDESRDSVTYPVSITI